jgi:hypothetical protein
VINEIIIGIIGGLVLLYAIFPLADRTIGPLLGLPIPRDWRPRRGTRLTIVVDVLGVAFMAFVERDLASAVGFGTLVFHDVWTYLEDDDDFQKRRRAAAAKAKVSFRSFAPSPIPAPTS